MIIGNHCIEPVISLNVINFNEFGHILCDLRIYRVQRVNVKIFFVFLSIIFKIFVILDGKNSCRVLLNNR